MRWAVEVLKIKNMKWLLVIFVDGSRFVYQSWKEHYLHQFAIAEMNPVFVRGEVMRRTAR